MARTALSTSIAAFQRARTAERQAAVGRLIAAKPDPRDWTAEEHVLFMDATGDDTVLPATPRPAPLPRDGVLDIRMGTDPGRNGFARKIDDEIPFGPTRARGSLVAPCC